MADPICRWRNATPSTLQLLVGLLPKVQMPEEQYRKILKSNCAERGFKFDTFTGTAYQLAAQLGLYYIDDSQVYHPRFDHDLTEEEAEAYLRKASRLYVSPNPYTPSMDKASSVICLHNYLAQYGRSRPRGFKIDVKSVLQEAYGIALGNMDIVINLMAQTGDFERADARHLIFTGGTEMTKDDFFKTFDKDATAASYVSGSVLLQFVFDVVEFLYNEDGLKSLFAHTGCSLSYDKASSPFLRLAYVHSDWRKSCVIPRLFIGCTGEELATKDDSRWFAKPFLVDYGDIGEWHLDNQWCDDLGREDEYKDESNRLRLSHFKNLIEAQYPKYEIVADGEYRKGSRRYGLIDKRDTLPGIVSSEQSAITGLASFVDEFEIAVSSAGLSYSREVIRRYVCGQLAKPFSVLTGLSGSGKTKLVQAFTEWIGVQRTYCLVPVGADWTNSEHLLGYPNALESGEYVMPETGVLKLLLDARDNPNLPFFLILDEMNLSHVERYFADFLSAMESGEDIKLHGAKGDLEGSDGTKVPPTIKFPKNLFVIGTMNVDETTYMFSPKVLDRAQVIEFRVSKEEMSAFLAEPTTPNLEAIAGKGAKYAEAFLRLKANPPPLDENGSVNKDAITAALTKFFEPLAGLGAEFGYRTASEVIRFCRYYLATGADITDAIDAAIVQKLLPKLHGSQQRLGPVLKKLKELSEKDKGVSEGGEAKTIRVPLYKLTWEKLDRMQVRLRANGFTSFAEA